VTSGGGLLAVTSDVGLGTRVQVTLPSGADTDGTDGEEDR